MKTGFHKKKAKIRLRPLFSSNLAFCGQLKLFHAQRWIFQGNRVLCLRTAWNVFCRSNLISGLFF